MNRMLGRLDWNRAAGLLVVLALHGAVLYGLWHARVLPLPAEAVTLFVNLIYPPPPQSRPKAIPPAEPKPPKPVKREAPRPVEPPHYHLAAEAPVVSPTDAVEPLPSPSPVVASPLPAPSALPPAPPQPAGPVNLKSELALACPKRTKPIYPPVAQRLGETGIVVLRVELDETGRVSATEVITSSGFKRLDAAALAAVRTWRCQPAQRDGQAVRSVATQQFKFTWEEH